MVAGKAECFRELSYFQRLSAHLGEYQVMGLDSMAGTRSWRVTDATVESWASKQGAVQGAAQTVGFGIKLASVLDLPFPSCVI